MLVDPSGSVDSWPLSAASSATYGLGESGSAIVVQGSLADALAINVATRLRVLLAHDRAQALILRRRLLAEQPGLTVLIAEGSVDEASAAAPLGEVTRHVIAPPSGFGWARLRLCRGDTTVRSWIDDPTIIAGGVQTASSFVVRKSGLWSIAQTGFLTRISGPVTPVALIHDEQRNRWQRLIWFRDRDGVERLIAVPEAQIVMAPREVMKRLINAGLDVAGANATTFLMDYLSQTNVEQRLVAVERTGWHGSHYVHPNGTIGSDTGKRPARPGSFSMAPEASVENLERWRHQVGSLAEGNSRLVLALCAAFGGLAIGLLPGQGSFGVHLRGMSSTGKTTALAVAASIHGPASGEIASWRATDNGLEAIAAEHHHRCMILDEIAQLDPRTAAQAAYTLGNGQGRARAKGTGRAAQIQRWQLIALSSGEIALEDKIREWSAAPTMREGQEVRFIDVPADAGKGGGIFEVLHGFDDGASLSEYLKAATERATGDVAIAFLRRLADDPVSARRILIEGREDFVAAHLPADADGIVRRVFGSLGLLAAAGEMAIRYGIVPWSAGSAIASVAVCAQAWRDARTVRHPRTPRAIAREWLHENLESLDIWEDAPASKGPILGYIRQKPYTICLLKDGWRALCQGHDMANLSAHLQAEGLMKYTCARLPGKKPQRFYIIDGAILAE